VGLWVDTPWLPVVSSLLFAFVGYRLGWAYALPAYLVFFSALLVITVVDLRWYLIPNRVIYPALLACTTLLAVAAVGEGDIRRLGSAFVGMAGAWLFFFIVWVAYPKGMGFGDVRLSALIGLMAGWIGFVYVVEAVLLGLVLGATTGVLLLVLRFRGRRDAIPFGPFLAGGAALAVLYGDAIGNFWLGTT